MVVIVSFKLSYEIIQIDTLRTLPKRCQQIFFYYFSQTIKLVIYFVLEKTITKKYLKLNYKIELTSDFERKIFVLDNENSSDQF